MAVWQTDADVVSAGRLIGLDTKNASPPTNAYIGINDQLQVYVASSLNPAYVRIYGRLLLPDGTIVPNDWTITSVSGRSGNVFPLPLAEGFLLSLSAYDSNASSPGQTYVRVSLQRSGTVNYTVAQVLLAGYVFTNNLLSWPNSPLWPMTYGHGNMRVITGTTPAAGAEISEQVPGNTRWRLLTFQFTLATAATAGNRFPIVVYDNGTVNYVATTPPTGIAASLGVAFNLATGFPSNDDATGTYMLPGITDHFMLAGFRIRTQTLNLQAGDQYGNVHYLVEEWLD